LLMIATLPEAQVLKLFFQPITEVSEINHPNLPDPAGDQLIVIVEPEAVSHLPTIKVGL